MDKQTEKKKMSIDELKEKIADKRAKIDVVYDQLKPLEHKRNILFGQLEKLNEKLGMAEIEEMESKQKIDWAWVIEDNDSCGMKVHEYKQRKLNELGLSSCGTLRETGQRIIQFYLQVDDEEYFKKVYNGLKKILPYIKPNEKGYKFIDLLEHTASRYGKYYMYVYPDKCVLAKWKWHKEHETKEFCNLKDCLRYIQRHHPIDYTCCDDCDD